MRTNMETMFCIFKKHPSKIWDGEKYIVNEKCVQLDIETIDVLPDSFYTELSELLQKYTTQENVSCSKDYLDWVHQANLQPLTNTQAKFAEWLLLNKNVKIISQIGDLDKIFTSVRNWVKKPKNN